MRTTATNFFNWLAVNRLGLVSAVLFALLLYAQWPYRHDKYSLFLPVLAIAVGALSAWVYWHLTHTDSPSAYHGPLPRQISSVNSVALCFSVACLGAYYFFGTLLYDAMPNHTMATLFLIGCGGAAFTAIVGNLVSIVLKRGRLTSRIPEGLIFLLLFFLIALPASWVTVKDSVKTVPESGISSQTEVASQKYILSLPLIIDGINAKRASISSRQLTPLKESYPLQQTASAFVGSIKKNPDQYEAIIKDETLKIELSGEYGYEYREIADISVTVPKGATEKTVVDHLFKDDGLVSILLADTLKDIGLAVGGVPGNDKIQLLYVLVGEPKEPEKSVAPIPPRQTQNTPTPTFTGVELFAAVNKSRIKHGVPELRQRNELCTVAAIRLNQQLELNKLDNHDGFNAVLDKYKEQLVDFSQIGENLASGNPTASDAVAKWEGSPGHLVMLKDGSYVWGCTAANRGFSVLIAAY